MLTLYAKFQTRLNESKLSQNTCPYYINTSEIPSELSRENFISSHVKITCYLVIFTREEISRFVFITLDESNC